MSQPENRPALWVVVPGTEFGMGLFRYFIVPTSITFDLNAADLADLLSVPDLSPALASAIVRDRDEHGSFASVDMLARVPGMTAGLLGQFRDMRSRMEARMKRTNDRRTDSGFMKDYLALVLKGSYYVAAAWQLGRALVLSGLGVLLVWRLLGWWTGMPGRQQASGPRRRWWRRAVRAMGRGIAAAVVPCIISVGLYAAGVLPTVGIMAIAGAACAAVIAVGFAAMPARVPNRLTRAVRLAAGAIVASLIIGAMY